MAEREGFEPEVVMIGRGRARSRSGRRCRSTVVCVTIVGPDPYETDGDKTRNVSAWARGGHASHGI